MKEKGLRTCHLGLGIFECPAKLLVGPMLIGVLIRALTLGIDDKFELMGTRLRLYLVPCRSRTGEVRMRVYD